MLRESSCYAPTRTVLKIVKAKQEMRFQVLILWCWMTLGQAFNLHFPYVHKWFQNSWQKQCCKNSLLLKKNTVFEKYLLPRFSNNLHTSFIHTAETLEMRKQNIWLVIHLTQLNQCNQLLIVEALKRQRSHILRFLLLVSLLTTGEIWGGCLWLLDHLSPQG